MFVLRVEDCPVQEHGNPENQKNSPPKHRQAFEVGGLTLYLIYKARHVLPQLQVARFRCQNPLVQLAGLGQPPGLFEGDPAVNEMLSLWQEGMRAIPV